jgi:hypothetical protein
MRHLASLVTLAFAAAASAAETPGARGDVVELPPMMVEESASTVPWLYLDAGGTEFLSRCSAGTTRDIAKAWLTKLQLLRAVVPEEFLARMDVPSVFVLYSQGLAQPLSPEILRELQGIADRSPSDGPRGTTGVNIAPSMRLADRDMHASIAYVDEAMFDGAALRIAPSHVRYLLKGRVPELPSWLIEGIDRAWQRMDFVLRPITLEPLVWLDSAESDELAGDRRAARARGGTRAGKPAPAPPTNPRSAAGIVFPLGHHHRRPDARRVLDVCRACRGGRGRRGDV